PHLPWDLLIVDECHNLMPSPFGEDSDLCRMLRLIAPQFEHRLFLSATPHNGHTRSFTGLLELLDPVRFSQTDELRPAERERVQQVVMRRLKREINARTSPPKFCSRLAPQALVLDMSREEVALSRAFDAFRTGMRSFIAAGTKRKRRAGSFAVEILGKRLLSCPVAFAESWRRCSEGLADSETAGEADVDTARKSVERETGDDRETQSREAVAAAVVGAWLKEAAADVADEIAAIDARIADLGLDCGGADLCEQTPRADARVDALLGVIDRLLRKPDGEWRDDERLVVFTEYKTTLDYVLRRLRERYDSERILTMYGGMDEVERDRIKQAFNDPAEPVRVLLATDAASEGLNLQRTARYLLHFDCPWNPSKLEQRNGRLDRHGQARDVQVFHFMTDADQDLRFLAHVIAKADEIREDLGSVNELFDEAAHRRLVDGESASSVQADLDKRIVLAQGRASIEADDDVVATAGVSITPSGTDGVTASDQLSALSSELDLDSDSLRETLEAAMAIRAGRPQLQRVDADGSYRLLNPGLPGWGEIIDESLRLGSGRPGLRGIAGEKGAVPRLAFDPEPCLEHIGERVVFNPRSDIALMHLSHPLVQRASSALTRRRFPGGGEEVSRWTARSGDVPDGADALVLLSLEELAVNELRETFHHWVRTVALPGSAGELHPPLAHRPAAEWGAGAPVVASGALARAGDLVDEVEPALKRYLTEHAARLTDALRREVETAGAAARAQEDERYRSRQGEVSTLIAENTLGKLEREIGKLKGERQQGTLFDEQARLDDLDRSIEEKQAEIERRRRHYEEVRAQLERERERILRYLLPKRYSMPEAAHVFPVTIEIRLPGGTP
ncbi:MAG TPA: helicase-related protein, partial [Thermoleophilia bacterium]|nr:helicase-related protein [Thermoleophilia bacterium]